MIPKLREWDAVREDIMPGKGMSYGIREDSDDMIGYRFHHMEDLDSINPDGSIDRVIMESTHLKDKNDVELYDGDVVLMKWTVYDEPTRFVIFKTYTGEWRVDDGIKGRVLGFSHEDVEKVGDVFTGKFTELREEWNIRQKQFERFIVGQRMKRKIF